MMPLRVVTVDDEELARQRLARLLARLPDVTLVAECATAFTALEAVERLGPDVVLLDVQMPGRDGVAVARELAGRTGDGAPQVVFVTAFDSHAVEAFGVAAVDYILKPVELDRLAAALLRVRQRIAERSSARTLRRMLALAGDAGAAAATPDDGGRSRYLDRILVREDDRMQFVRTADIDWIEADSNYVRLHVGARSHLVRERLTRLERVLDPDRFIRIHRSTIVNVDRVRELQPWFSGDLVVMLTDGRQLKLSRGYRHRIARYLRSG